MQINTNNLTTEQLNKLKETLPELFKKNRMPAKGDGYWYISGTASQSYWDNDSIDKDRLEVGNVFLTKEEAEKELEYRKALTTIRNYISDNFEDWTPDWSDRRQYKFYIVYEHETKRFMESNAVICQDFLPFRYLKTKEQCNQLIKDCEAELRIVMGV